MVINENVLMSDHLIPILILYVYTCQISILVLVFEKLWICIFLTKYSKIFVSRRCVYFA